MVTDDAEVVEGGRKQKQKKKKPSKKPGGKTKNKKTRLFVGKY